jgi:hypothetical protein
LRQTAAIELVEFKRVRRYTSSLSSGFSSTRLGARCSMPPNGLLECAALFRTTFPVTYVHFTDFNASAKCKRRKQRNMYHTWTNRTNPEPGPV